MLTRKQFAEIEIEVFAKRSVKQSLIKSIDFNELIFSEEKIKTFIVTNGIISQNRDKLRNSLAPRQSEFYTHLIAKNIKLSILRQI